MGKARAARIDSKYGPNERNLNPNNNVQRSIKKAQNQALRNKAQRNAVMRRIRKVTRKVRKVRQRDYVNAKAQLFGYWYYWFKEGLIGPEEDNNEPQLLAARYMADQHKMEHLLDHVR